MLFFAPIIAVAVIVFVATVVAIFSATFLLATGKYLR
jgi:hypothetical protein